MSNIHRDLQKANNEKIKSELIQFQYEMSLEESLGKDVYCWTWAAQVKEQP